MADFTELARTALAQADLHVADGDLEVLSMVTQAFDPAMRLLDTADVRQLPLEPDLDPSRAPRRAPESSAGPAARVADQPRARAPGRHPLIQLPSGPTLADGPNIRQAILADLAGIPGLSVPVGADASGLPIGLQLPAPWGEEARLLDAAELIEAARGALRAPPAHR